MFDWLEVTVTTYFDTGKEEVTYSHTPEEFVAELQKRGERYYVAKGSCAECHYTPDRFIPHDAVRKMNNEALTYHRIPECTRATVARYRCTPDVPDFIVCYGFYYQYCHQNKYLLAAKEAGLVTFYDVSNQPGFREAGLISYPEYFY